MRLNELTLAMGVSTLILAATQLPAQTRNHCAPRDVVVDRLAQGYGETRQSIGLGGNNAVVEVYASDQTGSWTITVTLPDGVTCIMASGQAFETLAEVLPVDDQDA